MNPSFVIRTASRAQLDWMVEQAAAEGWNPGRQDADAFYQADPNGFFVGVLDGQPVGCISAVSYPGGFGFIGFYIVKPAYRGKGLGIQLWQHAMRYLKDHNIGLDGVVAQQDNYRQSGFKLAYRNLRFAGLRDPEAAPQPHCIALAQVGFEQLTRYDRRYFPCHRQQFLHAWINLPGSHGVAYQVNGELQGYAVIRPCREGYKVGPLFAEGLQQAQALWQSITAFAKTGATVILDIPECNPAALALVQQAGLTKVFETARMYTGAAPDLALAGIYGITSFELG